MCTAAKKKAAVAVRVVAVVASVAMATVTTKAAVAAAVATDPSSRPAGTQGTVHYQAA